MFLSSYAKINLTLQINCRSKNKLHEIQSFFCLIDLADKINLKKIKTKKDRIIFDGPFAKLVNKSNNLSCVKCQLSYYNFHVIIALNSLIYFPTTLDSLNSFSNVLFPLSDNVSLSV